MTALLAAALAVLAPSTPARAEDPSAVSIDSAPASPKEVELDSWLAPAPKPGGPAPADARLSAKPPSDAAGSKGKKKKEVHPFSDLPFQTYVNAAAVPEHQGAHAGLRFTRNSGYSVGFLSGPEGYSSHCTITSTPQFVGQGCKGGMWVSQEPDGEPLPDGESEVAINQEATAGSVECVSTSSKKTGGACALRPNTRYYCNVVVSMPEADWTGNVPDANGVFGQRRKLCDAVIDSPLGYPESLR